MQANGNKVVLAYSGGLDTSCILRWLQEQGYEVVAYIANVGQDEDFDAAAHKARQLGATQVYVEDLRSEFVTDFVFPALRGNAIYESRYLLGTSLARPCIARRHVEIARREQCLWVSHGSTGKGNDQVRFELAYHALDPALRVIAPWRRPAFLERFKGRPDLLAYAAEQQIPVTATLQAPYSMDDNLFHISYESGVLEDPAQGPAPDMFRLTVALTDTAPTPDRISVHFVDGTPTEVVNHTTGERPSSPLDMLVHLNELGRRHGIGRIDIVENRYLGIKSRGVYETPGGTILREAHLDIEGLTMDRQVMRLRDSLVVAFSDLIYNGYWFSPEMEFLLQVMDTAQGGVTGVVHLELFRGRATVVGRASEVSRYNKDLVSMDIEGGFNPLDSEGFIRINALRLQAHHHLKQAGRAAT